ncbi:MAG: transglutaminase-like domain-containing protein [Candidatus Micrarchaeia archaeon]
MRHLALLSIILVLACSAFAQALDVKKIGYAKIEINQTINVSFNDSTDGVEYANLTLLYPSDSQTQKVTYFESSMPYSIITTPTGQEIQFTIANPQRQNVIETRTVMEIDYRGVKVGGSGENISQDDIDLYTSQGNLVIIDQKIRDTALQMKKSTAIDTVASIVSWTNQHMTYDKAYSNKNITTPEIIRALRGTCDEFAHLSLAFSRALGIPARFPIGYVYSGQEWGLHAWVEFFVPGYGWIEADPTYNELGKIDASHVRLAYGQDQSAINQKIVVYGYRQPKAALGQDYSIGFLDTANFTGEIEMGANAAEVNRTAENITVMAKSHTPSEIFLPIELYPAQELSIENKQTTLLRVQPYGSANVTYTLDVPEGQQDIIYTYPVRISTPYADQTISFSRLVRSVQEEGNSSGQQAATGAQAALPCLPAAFALLFPLVLIAGFFTGKRE